MNLDEVTPATFEPLVSQRFRVKLSESNQIEVELIQATRLPSEPRRAGSRLRREPFALLFRGPKDLVLAQRIYPIEQDALGMLEIFLVPIGPDDIGMRYEAIFN